MYLYCCVLVLTTLISGITGNVGLNVTDVRLADGSGVYEGRVEVKIQGVWGTLCDRGFQNYDGMVLCRMMGLAYTTHFPDARYGQGTGPIFADSFGCSGSESHISQCSFTAATTCYHRDDVSLICSRCGGITLSYGVINSISANGTTLSTSCNSGYESDQTTSICNSSGSWSPSIITCIKPVQKPNITDMRLTGGVGLYDGRVEVMVNGTWSDICIYSFDDDDATTICNILFGIPKYTHFQAYYYGYGYGSYTYIDQLGCIGNETDINKCYFKLREGYCNYDYRAAVVCYGYPINITDIQLADGSGTYDGRVELEYDGYWRTMCGYYFDVSDAQFLCRMMNLSMTTYYTNGKFGPGTGPILIGGLNCDSDADHINDCTFTPPIRRYCSHGTDVGLVCTECGIANFSNGAITSSNGTTMTVTCNKGYAPTTYTLECLSNGTWLYNDKCEVYGYPLNITNMTLADGVGLYDGRLEVEVNGTWGTVCSSSFSNSEARAICNIMFGTPDYRTYTSASYYGYGTGPIYIDRLDCNGTETNINQCKYYVLNTCSHSSDISIVCKDNQLNITEIRLIPGPYHGRVDINSNDTWGAVCYSGFGYYDDAVAICGMMGGLGRYDTYGSAYNGSGLGPVNINLLQCSSNEVDINRCSYIYAHDCTSTQHASVTCYGPYLNITSNDVQLANGTGQYDGRAEIRVNGKWGTICDNYFGIYDADAFCRMLGLRATQYFTGAMYGEGKGPVHIDSLHCREGTTNLNDCPYLHIDDCDHTRDVSVVCNECGQPDISYWDIDYFSFNGSTLYADCSYYKTYLGTLSMTCNNETNEWKTEGECQEYSFPLDITDIRLADGNTSSEGRVEIKSMETWGTICHDNFGMNEAHMICTMLGYWPAVAYYSNSAYGTGSGPIFIDDLQCETNVSHINNCTYVTYDDCTHNEDISVVCLDCGNPTPSNGMINATQTNYGTVVEVSCEIGYILVGNDTIMCETNGNWNDIPYCHYIDCGNPEPENGVINSTSTGNGTVVMVSCDTGYNISGDSIITCQIDDKWTDYPTCEILDCGMPMPENANVELPSNATTYGAIAVISCKHGYLPDGSSTITCLETGQWEDMPVCEIVDCGDPTPFEGSRNDTNTTYGAVVEITCNDGLEMRGNSTIVCQLDGTWSDNPVCSANDCGRPSISNGQVDDSNGTITDSIATITCNPGYDLVGSAAVICLSKGWNDTDMECIIQDCRDPTPDNGMIVKIDGIMYGDTATLECNEGYEMEGDSIITCEDGGRWSSDPVCIIRDCGNLESPENGDKDTSNGTVFNSTVTFTCDTGFLLEGETTLICQSNGQWSSVIPTCTKLGNIGEYCKTDVYCKAEGAVCTRSACACETGVYDKNSNKCDTMYLYPYGTSENDKALNDWDKCSGKKDIQFSPGIPFLGKTHTTIFVCPHGIVSFTSSYKRHRPRKFSIGGTVNSEVHVLAPFYAYMSATSGAVYYRFYDVLNSYDSLKRSPEVKDIEKRVNQFSTTSSFKASFVLIATWENVLPESADLNKVMSKPSTFQLVLVSDGERTYSMFIYPNGRMNWISKKQDYAPVWVGYFGTDTYNFTHQHSFYPSVLALDTNSKHSNVSGVVFKSLVQEKDITTNKNVRCVTWYQENKHEKEDIDLFNSRLPECPCSIWQARWDPWFWHIDRWNWYHNKNYTCVDMLPGRPYKPYGKSCCYDYRTAWVDERPITGGFYRYHPEHAADHAKHDVEPKDMCCSPFSDFCHYYYTLRPSGTCYRRSPYDFGSFWGDPHFRTLDGLNFTFNGLGEYTLLEIQTENTTFALQARTERAVKGNGNISDATVFSAFAAKDETNASFHVELNRAKRGFNIYGNGVDLTNQYTQKTSNDNPLLNVPGGTLFVSKRGETLFVLFPSSGISLNISINVGMLSLSAIIPKKYNNLTRGLLGNYNGKAEDDFMMSNGTKLDADISERKVFSYGQTWEIDGNNSAFVYPDGKNHTNFHNSTYVPRFLDEIDPVKRKEAENVCNGKEDVECVFDYVFTGNKDAALSTKMIKEVGDKTKKEMDEVIPSLVGCERASINVKDNVICPISIDDANTIEFIANNVNATFNKYLSYISYTPINTEPVDISVIATNANGRSSPAFIVDVWLCSGCNEHGTCTEVPRIDVPYYEHFQYATCECEPEYEGPDCENVFDGCSEAPCSLGRSCTSLNVTRQRELNRAYLCDACPIGYTSADKFNDSCADVDECDNTPCTHYCTNTEGSYECSCKEGYRIDTRDKHMCTDINECEDLNIPHNCEQDCTNTDGSFTCSCFNGYNLTHEGTCELDYAMENKCYGRSCLDNEMCILDNSDDAICVCNPGYERNAYNNCRDIDECQRKVCPQNCQNTEGGFECSCFSGYKLEGRTTCKECDVGFWGDNCANTCECSGEGVAYCDRVKGCICQHGWQGASCEVDINECNSTMDVCQDPRMTCENMPGSYVCSCMDGFYETNEGKCEDVDECNVSYQNTCDQRCKNTIGSYSCECNAGYISTPSGCENIDECLLHAHKCEQKCEDNPGSYNCLCYFGYVLNDDRRTCTKQMDPCLAVHGFNCSHYCYIDSNHAECRCSDGFILGTDFQTCTDIDECKTGDNICDINGECVNTEGSFTCKCPSGTQLENDGRTCTECDEYHFGVNCASTCSCLHGYCNKIIGCVCDAGWRGNNCDIDFDECDSGVLSCQNQNEMCVNTPGSADCDCNDGFHRNEYDECVDIDECSDVRLNTCDQRCMNTLGGYICECENGFLFTDGKCQDINECENGKSECQQLCANTLGSYRCYCEDGFKLDKTDLVSCKAAIECSSNTCGNHAVCFNNNGVDECRCVNGFQKDISGQCIDVNECREVSNHCSQNCTNTPGSFNCSCYNGYYLAKDQTTCKECEIGTFGRDCVMTCSCNPKNTVSCDHITGECSCTTGWTGTNCDQDINECRNITICPENSECENTNGSYNCKCNEGYFKLPSGLCSACDDRHYGWNCANECTCNDLNTVSCDNVNGSCKCKEGWLGTTCSADANECEADTNICDIKINSTCSNTPGSYRCMCDDGYRETGNTCVDINECIGDNTCDHHCVNTMGGYTCQCRRGYHGYWNNCEQCSNNTFGDNCTKTCDCNNEHTAFVDVDQACDRVTGKCTCLPNWEGDFCMEDFNECSDGTKCNTKPNYRCVNTFGWYKCNCKDGYKEIGSQCFSETAFSMSFNLVIDISLPDSIAFVLEESYQTYETKAKDSLMNYYKSFTTATIDIVITGLRKGSLIVNFTVIYEGDDGEVISKLVKAATELNTEGSSFTFDGQSYPVNLTSETIDINEGQCRILHEFGTCKLDKCVEEKGFAKCRNKPEDGLTLPQIIGITVGCGVFFVFMTITVIVCKRGDSNDKKRRDRKPRSRYKEFDDTQNSQKHDVRRGDRGYFNWRTKQTQHQMSSRMDRQTFDEPYKISRPKARLPTKISTNDYTY